jgi:glycosyltransferase involved in cell wall biosynthesis
VVASLLDQAGDVENGLEVVIVDDGSKEGVAAEVRALAAGKCQEDAVRYLSQSQKGPAAARNLGIQAATGRIVLFLGDDIMPGPGLLREHVSVNTEHSGKAVAVLGMADLAPEFCLTPFVQWWQQWNFRYRLLLEGKRSPDYSFFYTNNLSVSRKYLLDNGLFDEEFRHAAYEDSELGYRLTGLGLALVFHPKAQAFHHHAIDLRAACQRMVARGKSYDLFLRKTGAVGMSRLWLLVGEGPWMRQKVLDVAYDLADSLQGRRQVGILNILVLMFFFQAARNRLSIVDRRGIL